MIVAEQKPVEEILSSLGNHRNVVIASCGTCVTVCLAGGEKEALELKELLSLSDRKNGIERWYTVVHLKRQCDAEFIEDKEEGFRGADAILSLACGAGIQFSERFADLPFCRVSTPGSLAPTGDRDTGRRCARAVGTASWSRPGGSALSPAAPNRISTDPAGVRRTGSAR
jgi:ferredoxin